MSRDRHEQNRLSWNEATRAHNTHKRDQAKFLREGVACDLFLTTQQCMDHPQTLHNEGVVDVVDPELGKTRQIGPLVRFSKTPSRIDRPAPQLDEHRAEILRTCHMRVRDAALREGGVAPPRPARLRPAPGVPLRALKLLV